MSQGDSFTVIWCVVVVLIGGVNLAWGIRELKRGSARFSSHGQRYYRDRDPIEFWIAAGLKLLAVPAAAVMIWFGLISFGSM